MNRRAFLMVGAGAAVWPGVMGCRAEPAPIQAPDDIANSGDPAFDAWMDGFYRKALADGLPRAVVDKELADLTPDAEVVRRDQNQPEFSRPISSYVKGAVSADRIETGRTKKSQLGWLRQVEFDYGVPAEVLIAIWAMETAFGQIQGDFDVIRTLATLAADGRRRALFEDNLIAALKIIASGEAARWQLVGSGAGAMGQTQFMPADYLTTCVDSDGDGRRDIWNSSQDALASAANLLSKADWKFRESWQREVLTAEDFDWSMVEGPRLPPQAWAVYGVRPADNGGWSGPDSLSEAQLIAPSGAAGPKFLLFPNHFVIRKYNNSTAYALGVGLLASRIAGEGPLITPWPEETGLSTAQRTGAQQALADMGYDPGVVDGVIGPNTRKAVRAWQLERKMLADGYLTPALADALIAEAAAR